jgi:uncharacterized membrane protein HdeD (DUF308 family)
MIFEAILFILLGLLAIALPQLATLGITLLIGTLLVVAGIAEGIYLLRHMQAPGFWATLLSSILSLILGIMILSRPMVGIFTLTYLLIAYFLIEGISKIYYSLELKHLPKWGWILTSGILSVILAFLIITGLPGTAGWVLGLLLGINMIFFGVALLALSSKLPESS